MPSHRIARLLSLITALACGPVMAYPENPFLTPEHPRAQDAVIINASAGPCDSLQYAFADPEVTRVGNQITVQLKGVHVDDPIWCVFGSRIDQVSIGTFPPGSYTVTVNWQFTAFPEPVNILLGVLPLTVVNAPAAAPVSLPASDRPGLFTLMFMLIAAATWWLRSAQKAQSED